MKKIILAVAVAALAIMAVASSASAGVERYQSQTATIHRDVHPAGQGEPVGRTCGRTTYHGHRQPVRRHVHGYRHGVRMATRLVPGDETIRATLRQRSVSLTATRECDRPFVHGGHRAARQRDGVSADARKWSSRGRRRDEGDESDRHDSRATSRTTASTSSRLVAATMQPTRASECPFTKAHRPRAFLGGGLSAAPSLSDRVARRRDVGLYLHAAVSLASGRGAEVCSRMDGKCSATRPRGRRSSRRATSRLRSSS